MTLGDSHWPHPESAKRPQPVLVSLAIPFSLELAASGDNLPDTVNYGTLCKTIESLSRQTDDTFGSVEAFAEGISRACLDRFPAISRIKVKVEKTRALLHGKSAGIEMVRSRKPVNDVSIEDFEEDSWFIRDLDIPAIIGVHPWERQEEQIVRINIQWHCSLPRNETGFDFRALARAVTDFVEPSSYQTIESLASGIAQVGLSISQGLTRITVCVGKPSALMFAASGAVEITRSLDLTSPATLQSSIHQTPLYALALGSNLGDRFGNIERALRMLESVHGVKVIDTSFLYETEPMYVTDQPSFVNGACLISTPLTPPALLAILKEVESSIGRTPGIRNGPRVVDLDIIFYGDQVLHLKDPLELIVPHRGMQEREFVLRPLADMIPDFIHPTLKRTVSSLLSSLLSANPPTKPMYRVLSFPLIPYDSDPDGSLPAHYLVLSHRTYLMATLNATPDSFSDGGLHLSVSDAVEFAREAKEAGADIIDIGGHSTRPGSQHVDPHDEVQRTVPIIKAIRDSGLSRIPISIDTFRGVVAEAAIRAGANCINDVYALTADEEILGVAVRTGVPVVMMHSRGAADQNNAYQVSSPEQSYEDAVLEAVKTELGLKVRKAMGAGVRRWNVIVDPGIGFSKTLRGNVGLLRNLSKLTSKSASSRNHSPLASFPMLVGTSRKSFLGTLIERPHSSAKERSYATGASCAAAVQQGADIVRVHDVKEMKDVLRVSDAIWRGVV